MTQDIRQLNLAFMGFGHVGRAFARLLLSRRAWLRREMGVECRVTGIASLDHGLAIDPAGIPLHKALGSRKSAFGLDRYHEGPACASTLDFVRQCGADVLFEMSVLSLTGEPAATYIGEALRAGLHVVTVNKGPVATHFRSLTRLARLRAVRFLYEGTVMDGTPVFNLVRQNLPSTRILSLRGILNSTTNYILSQMELGASFESALSYTQANGIAEADPSLDLDGWDAAFKLSILIQAMMGGTTRPDEIRREGISEETGRLVRSAVRRDRRIRLVARAYRHGGQVVGKVEPEELEVFDPLASIRGLSNILILNTDTMGELAIIENNPDVRQTAFALFTDLVTLLIRPRR
ncbi:MAG: homoserine dehydrogenase [Acidobacteria bacterium]|nr:homoserine dehydrogenase [Acidobacteriota bacterium]